MGSKNSTLELDSDKYDTGSVINGKFWIRTDEPNEIIEIYVELLRMEKTNFSIPRSRYDSDRKQDVTYYEEKGTTKEVAENKIKLIDDPAQLRIYWIRKDGNYHEYNFNFALDIFSCPSSLSLSSGSITYYVRATAIKKSKLKFNITSDKKITIANKKEIDLVPFRLLVKKHGFEIIFEFTTQQFFFDKQYPVRIVVRNHSKYKIKKFIVEILRDATFVGTDTEHTESQSMFGSLPCIVDCTMSKDILPNEIDDFGVILDMPENGVPTTFGELITIHHYLKVSIKTNEFFGSKYSSDKQYITVCS